MFAFNVPLAIYHLTVGLQRAHHAHVRWLVFRRRTMCPSFPMATFQHIHLQNLLSFKKDAFNFMCIVWGGWGGGEGFFLECGGMAWETSLVQCHGLTWGCRLKRARSWLGSLSPVRMWPGTVYRGLRGTEAIKRDTHCIPRLTGLHPAENYWGNSHGSLELYGGHGALRWRDGLNRTYT